MPKQAHWILQTAPHITETRIPLEGDRWSYSVSPENMVKRGDTVYLWLNYERSLYGWGEVAETPQIIYEPIVGQEPEKRKRQLIPLDRRRELYPRIMESTMLTDRHVKNLVPPLLDDLYALELTTVKANYLNDFIREQQMKAPKGSATVRWLAEPNAPQFIIQALLTFGENVDEGRLVESVNLPWFEIIKLIKSDPDELYKIDPRKFEELIAGAYDRYGFFDEVILTPRSNDKGRDIVAVKHGSCSIRIFDQVKRYRMSNVVTAEEVRALVGTISMAPNVSKGIITTSSTFAPNLLNDEDIARLVPFRLELRPRSVLLQWLEGLGID